MQITEDVVVVGYKVCKITPEMYAEPVVDLPGWFGRDIWNCADCQTTAPSAKQTLHHL